MAVTTSLYNHTASLFANGTNLASNSYRVILLSAGTFVATNTTLVQASSTYTELSTANGYTAGGLLLANISVTITSTNDAKFDADDALWNATGSGITAAKAILYNDSVANDPPLLFIDFGNNEFAPATTDFKIVWPAAGIFSFVTP